MIDPKRKEKGKSIVFIDIFFLYYLSMLYLGLWKEPRINFHFAEIVFNCCKVKERQTEKETDRIAPEKKAN